jgi:hypothetical protein
MDEQERVEAKASSPGAERVGGDEVAGDERSTRVGGAGGGLSPKGA